MIESIFYFVLLIELNSMFLLCIMIKDAFKTGTSFLSYPIFKVCQSIKVPRNACAARDDASLLWALRMDIGDMISHLLMRLRNLLYSQFILFEFVVRKHTDKFLEG